jgi:hypothetical protein
MAVLASDVPYPWFRKELVFQGNIQRGQKNKRVRFVQEMTALQGFRTGIDGDFGPGTTEVVGQFQVARGLARTGVVDEPTFDALIQPLLRALTPIEGFQGSYGELVVAYARQHLAEHPREVGGQNGGPWVRLYMRGHEGTDWAWCAGFVCFLLQQAADTSNARVPFKRTFSCDVLAERAKNAGLFRSERDLDRDDPARAGVPPGSLFLVRKTSSDWTHTGLVTECQAETFGTIEGNTNDDGHREGYEVCARTRAYPKRDFIVCG